MFWNETLGLWRDLRLDLSLNGSFYGSSISPLVWRCGQGGVERDEKFLSTLESLGVLEYPGGIPASVWSNSTQQWDYPNAWAPIQWMLVEAWHDSPSKQLRAVAEKVARTWLTTTYLAWERFNQTMFEKVGVDCAPITSKHLLCSLPLSSITVQRQGSQGEEASTTPRYYYTTRGTFSLQNLYHEFLLKSE